MDGLHVCILILYAGIFSVLLGVFRSKSDLLLDAERGRGIVVGELLLVSRRERGK